MEEISEEKQKLRNAMNGILGAIPPDVRREKDMMIKKNFLELKEYRDAVNVLLFASFRNEVDTVPIINDALSSKRNVVLPRVNSTRKELELYTIRSTDDLEPGYSKIPEPRISGENRFNADELDLIMLPGLAFDLRGGRMGYGGGYYDRLLAGLKTEPALAAVAYMEQIVDHVPVTEHDRKVMIIVTDSKTITVN